MNNQWSCISSTNSISTWRYLCTTWVLAVSCVVMTTSSLLLLTLSSTSLFFPLWYTLDRGIEGHMTVTWLFLLLRWKKFTAIYPHLRWLHSSISLVQLYSTELGHTTKKKPFPPIGWLNHDDMWLVWWSCDYSVVIMWLVWWSCD